MEAVVTMLHHPLDMVLAVATLQVGKVSTLLKAKGTSTKANILGDRKIATGG